MEIGFSEREIATLLSKGILCHIEGRPGVYRSAGVPLSRDQASLAAVLATSHDAVLGALSAAGHWMFRSFPDAALIELLITTDHRVRLTGVRTHRTVSLPPSHRTVLRGVPVTTPERTIVDVCGQVPDRMLERAADDLRRRHLLDVRRLASVVDEVPRSGRRRIRPVRAYLDTHESHPGDNDGELQVMKVLRQAGVHPLPEQQLRVRAGGRSLRLDYAYPYTKQCLEWMGFDPHGLLVSVFHNDADRTRALQRAGWRIWPLTARTSDDELVELALELAAAEQAARLRHRPGSAA